MKTRSGFCRRIPMLPARFAGLGLSEETCTRFAWTVFSAPELSREPKREMPGGLSTTRPRMNVARKLSRNCARCSRHNWNCMPGCCATCTGKMRRCAPDCITRACSHSTGGRCDSKILRRGHSQADGAHQLQRVAGLHNAGLEFVIEDELLIFQMVFEVAVDGTVAERGRNLSQRQIMGADYTDGAAIQQFAQHELSAGQTVVRVCSRE